MPADIPTELDAALGRADVAYHALDLDAALAAYQEAITLDPTCYEAQLGVARTESRRRRRSEALEACARCIELDPARYEAYATQATVHFLADALPEAEAACQEALQRSDSDAEPLLTLAQIACDRRNFTQADDYIAQARERIASMDPGQEQTALEAMAWHAQTYRHLLANEQEAARKAAQEVVDREAASPYAAALAWSNLGIMDARARRYDSAISYLERAYATNPHFGRAAAALGRLLIMQGQPARAAEILGAIVEQSEADRGESRYAYAVALAKSGDKQAAREQYQLALQDGLGGISRLQAGWQLLWLNQTVRGVMLALMAVAFILWVVTSKPSQQAITLVVMIAMLVVLQRVFSRRR
ncbi:MAG: tetratricopeptide repeat protein [Anaerolineae bacterium]|jgi:tetratricopeptide (TPR) repeat protein|nr:tetratricopeptide repeat protein [Chloroflexota bacterium]